MLSKPLSPHREPLCYLSLVGDAAAALMAAVGVLLFFRKGSITSAIALSLLALLALWLFRAAFQKLRRCRVLAHISTRDGQLYYDGSPIESISFSQGRTLQLEAGGRSVEVDTFLLPILCRYLSQEEAERLQLPHCPPYDLSLLVGVAAAAVLLSLALAFLLPLIRSFV